MSKTRNRKPIAESTSPNVRLITVQQLAKNTGVSIRTLWKRVESGDLPKPFKFGGRAVWREKTISDAFESMEEKAG